MFVTGRVYSGQAPVTPPKQTALGFLEIASYCLRRLHSLSDCHNTAFEVLFGSFSLQDTQRWKWRNVFVLMCSIFLRGRHWQ